jgi:hypothetical protein
MGSISIVAKESANVVDLDLDKLLVSITIVLIPNMQKIPVSIAL